MKVLIFNNGSLGFIELEQKSSGFINTETGLDDHGQSSSSSRSSSPTAPSAAACRSPVQRDAGVSPIRGLRAGSLGSLPLEDAATTRHRCDDHGAAGELEGDGLRRPGARQAAADRAAGGDARSLEWATASPPPVFNFAVLPEVHGEEAYWGIKQRAREQASLRGEPTYEAIEVPLNSATGFICAFFATIVGFAMIWHIWWLALAGLACAVATFVVFAWRDKVEYEIPAADVARVDRANRATRTEALSGVRRRAA